MFMCDTSASFDVGSTYDAILSVPSKNLLMNLLALYFAF